jgi:hypothetical protein
MSLVFVFMLASGAVLYQPLSDENCAKLMLAFAQNEKVVATIEGMEARIVRGTCVRLDQVDIAIQNLKTIDRAPAS